MRAHLVPLLIGPLLGTMACGHVQRGASRASTPAFFTVDPTIDGLALPVEPWSFRQETWTGAPASQQHCRELGYPTRLRERLVTEMNTMLVAHGLPGTLPETVRGAHVAVTIAEWRPAVVVTTEPLVKLIVCSEGMLPRSARASLDASVASDPRIVELGFGAPVGVWKREHASGEREVGAFWAGVTPERAAAAFEAHGYRMEEDPEYRVRAWHLGTRATARELGQLWWTGLVETPAPAR